MSDLTLPEAREQRNSLASRTDVLDKVGVLVTLPDGVHVTTEMIATFYEVGAEAIRWHVKNNRGELDDDGYRVVTRSVFEQEFGSLSNLDPRARSIALFPRRAVLRVGMLLRDSVVARRVRDYLLEAERPAFTIPQNYAEALRAAADQSDRADMAERKAAELEPKAALADDFLIAEGGARLVGQVAKLIGWKEKDLRRWLIDEKLVFVRHSPCGAIQYNFYAEFAHHFQARETIVNHTWGTCTHYTLYILPRGVELIRKRITRTAVSSQLMPLTFDGESK